VELCGGDRPRGKGTAEELHVKRPIKDEARLNEIASLGHAAIPWFAFHKRYQLAIALPHATACNSRILLHVPAAGPLEDMKSTCIWWGGHEEMWCVSGQGSHPGHGVQKHFLLS